MAPKLVKFDRWSITKESEMHVVKRWEHFDNGTKKLARMPITEYRKYREKGLAALTEFVARENYRLFKHEEAEKKWKLKTSFIKGKDIREGFFNYKVQKTANPDYAHKCVNMVKKYVLDFFMETEGNFDYLTWVKPKNQAMLVDALLSNNDKILKDGAVISYSTIKTIKENVNHFFEYLHYESEGEIPLLRFDFGSLTPAVKKKHEAERKRSGGKRSERKEGHYISQEEFDVIYENSPDELKGPIYLAYYYGLRINEALAIRPEDLRGDYLFVNKRQKDTQNRNELTKSRLNRKVYHIYKKRNLQEVYDHIKMVNENVVHYTNVAHKWRELCDYLGYNYNIHSLRNTFCTNLLDNLRKFNLEATDVQDIMGHADLTTTLKYRRNSKTELDDSVFTPS